MSTCPRCGIRRMVRHGRQTKTCTECRVRIPEPTERHALTDGEWRGQNGIQVWVANPRCYCGARLIDGTCVTCIKWAEKDARLHAEAAQSWANRHVIWNILDARKERVDAA